MLLPCRPQAVSVGQHAPVQRCSWRSVAAIILFHGVQTSQRRGILNTYLVDVVRRFRELFAAPPDSVLHPSRLDSCTASPRSLSMPIFQSPKHTKISKSSRCKISVQSSSREGAKSGHTTHGQYPSSARSNTVQNRHISRKPLTHRPKNQPPRQREVAPQPPLADPDPTTGTEQFWRENTS